jgi:hypothetical protein
MLSRPPLSSVCCLHRVQFAIFSCPVISSHPDVATIVMMQYVVLPLPAQQEAPSHWYVLAIRTGARIVTRQCLCFVHSRALQEPPATSQVPGTVPSWLVRLGHLLLTQGDKEGCVVMHFRVGLAWRGTTSKCWLIVASLAATMSGGCVVNDRPGTSCRPRLCLQGSACWTGHWGVFYRCLGGGHTRVWASLHIAISFSSGASWAPDGMQLHTNGRTDVQSLMSGGGSHSCHFDLHLPPAEVSGVHCSRSQPERGCRTLHA